jgi:FHS family L-fucose permease-like MFS transporter
MREPLVPREHVLAFSLLTACFAAWGLANNMTDPLVRVFSRVFTMSQTESALVQFAFYGAYFCMALPAALLIRRTTYKTGVLVGLGLFILGALLFFPAANTMKYWHFLIALYVLACGLSILETSANPFIMALGPAATATRRLNFAQAFNPVGSNLGILLATYFIVANISELSDEERTALRSSDPVAFEELTRRDLGAVMGPYLGTALGLSALWLAIAAKRMPKYHDKGELDPLPRVFGRLFKNAHFVWGVVAQFFYVAAQICVWTFLIQYAADCAGLSDTAGAGYLQASLIVFLVARFAGTALMGKFSPALLLLLSGVGGVLCCVYAVVFPGQAGLVALVAVSGFMAIMFPTIYGIALEDVGPDKKIGAALLVMAILGGALLPIVQGKVIDTAGAAVSYAVSTFCLIVVAVYAGWSLVRKATAER